LPPLALPAAPDASPRRTLGVSYEDPCSHASDLGATQFDQWLDRMATFLKFSGMNRLTYPLVWYHGPLYPSPTETPNYFDWSVAAPATRNLYIRWTTQPGDWVAELLDRFDREGLEFVSQVTYIRLPSLMAKMNIDMAAIQAGADTINNLRADNRVQAGAGDWTGEYNVRNFDRQRGRGPDLQSPAPGRATGAGAFGARNCPALRTAPRLPRATHLLLRLLHAGLRLIACRLRRLVRPPLRARDGRPGAGRRHGARPVLQAVRISHFARDARAMGGLAVREDHRDHLPHARRLDRGAARLAT
jgi:hypothetical protein